MKRTQIYLDQKLIKLLATLAKDTGKTRSELIRDALREVYNTSVVDDTLQKVQNLKSFNAIGVNSSSNILQSNLRISREWS